MPNAFTHFLIAAVLAALFRDYIVKDKSKFPLYYVLIAGLGGMVLDLDYAIYLILELFGKNLPSHRVFFHNLAFPILFFLFGILFAIYRNKSFKKTGIKLSYVAFIIAFASIVHLILDALIVGVINPLQPIYDYPIGLNLIGMFPEYAQNAILGIIDAVLLAGWMIYMQLKHKISDFI